MSTNQTTPDERFDEVHAALAAIGVCDSTGGMEYTRVKEEWIKAGRPRSVAAFVEARSNIGPDDDEVNDGEDDWDTNPRTRVMCFVDTMLEDFPEEMNDTDLLAEVASYVAWNRRYEEEKAIAEAVEAAKAAAE